MVKKIFYFLLILFFITSCDIITEPELFNNSNLSKYHIHINEEDYGLLKKNIFSNLKVNCSLFIENKEYTARIRYQGYSSRGNFKKNYEIEYKVVPDTYTEKIILSAQATDPSMIRAILANEIFKSTNLHMFDIKPIILYINNNLEGLYYAIELINNNFFIKRSIRPEEIYKAINGRAQFHFDLLKGLEYGFEKEYPDDKNYYTLSKLISITSSDSTQFFNEIEKVFDVEKYLQYWAATILTCNWDGVVHNFYLLKSNGKYEIVPWDIDRTFTMEYNLTEFPGNNYLIKKLLKHTKYRSMYKKYYNQLLKNTFNESYLFPKIDSLKSLISIPYYEDRWIKSNNYNLDYETEKIKIFIKERISYIQKQLN